MPKIGDEIAVPNDTTNEARALLLLQDNGIITLKEGVGLEATVNDIEENPNNIEIVELEAKRRGFGIEPEAVEKVTAICNATAGDVEAGNGRFCRNLVEGAILEYALRNFDGKKEPAGVDFLLRAEDFSVPSNFKKVHNTQQIGFAA